MKDRQPTAIRGAILRAGRLFFLAARAKARAYWCPGGNTLQGPQSIPQEGGCLLRIWSKFHQQKGALL